MSHDVSPTVEQLAAELQGARRRIAMLEAAAAADAAKRERVEEELRTTEARFRALVEQAPIGIYLTDAKGDCSFVNARWSEMAGLSQDEALGQGWLQAVHPDDRATIGERWYRSAQSGGVWGFEYRFRDRNGKDTWVHGTAAPLRDARGQTVGHVGVNTDIDARREAEAGLRQVKEMRDVAETIAHVGSWRWELASRKAAWSPGMYELFDVDPGAFDGDSMPILEARVHPDDLEALLATTAGVAETGKPIVVEYRVINRDGSEHVLHGEGAGERGEAGAIVAIAGYYQDVTDQRRAEAEIRRLNAELEERVVTRTIQRDALNRELEAFAYSASHDLRAPLRAIDGFTAMIEEDAAGRLNGEDLEHLQRVRSAAQRMMQLVDDLLGLSRVSRQDLLRVPVDVSALCAELAGDLRAGDPPRRVDVSIAPGMTANADAALLRVILSQLLDNAWKFTAKHDQARIEVGATDVGEERVFCVRDDGSGFDPRYAEHLFGAFQRLHPATEFPGDGIGLATVQRLVIRHGGRLWAESAVEQGAAFFFTLQPQAG